MVLSKSCIIVLVGLPGCGKSFFCNEFVKIYQKLEVEKNKRILHICYDSLMFSNDGKCQLNEWTTNWSDKRTVIFNCIDWHISTLMQEETFDCAKIPSGDIFDAFQRYMDDMSTVCDLVYLIDDNMYYESMRYKYFQLARKHEIGFAQIYFDVSLELCLLRNKNRDNVIPEDIIIEMSNKLEKPDFNQKWKKDTLIVNPTMDFDNVITMAHSLIMNAIEEKLINEEPFKHEQKVQSQTISSQNFRHQCDQILRKIVSEELCEKSKCLSADEMKVHATSTNNIKKLTFKKICDFDAEIIEKLSVELLKDGSSFLPNLVKQTFLDIKTMHH